MEKDKTRQRRASRNMRGHPTHDPETCKPSRLRCGVVRQESHSKGSRAHGAAETPRMNGTSVQVAKACANSNTGLTGNQLIYSEWLVNGAGMKNPRQSAREGTGRCRVGVPRYDFDSRGRRSEGSGQSPLWSNIHIHVAVGRRSPGTVLSWHQFSPLQGNRCIRTGDVRFPFFFFQFLRIECPA